MRSTKFDIRGVSYRVNGSMLKKMSPLLPLRATLVREPDNEYDANAVKVVLVEKPWNNLHIGYIDRAIASVLAPRMDSGKITVVNAYVTALSLEERDDEEHSSSVLVEYRSQAKQESKTATRKRKNPAAKPKIPK